MPVTIVTLPERHASVLLALQAAGAASSAAAVAAKVERHDDAPEPDPRGIGQTLRSLRDKYNAVELRPDGWHLTRAGRNKLRRL